MLKKWGNRNSGRKISLSKRKENGWKTLITKGRGGGGWGGMTEGSKSAKEIKWLLKKSGWSLNLNKRGQ